MGKAGASTRDGQHELVCCGDHAGVVEHSADVQGLRDRIVAARGVRVFDSGCLHYDDPEPDRILGEKPVLSLNEPTQVAKAVELLAVESVSDSECMYTGDVTLEFLDGEENRLAAVGLHHGSYVRWSGWSCDAVLKDGSGLLEWLAGHGVARPLQDRERDDVRRDFALAQRASWKKAVPECVQSLADEMVAVAPWEQELVVGRVSTRMEVAYPDDVQRCRALLAWFGAGSAACSGYPSYEGIPGSIIESMSMDVVLATLRGEPVGSPVWAGALRHIAGWKSRADYELRRVPVDVWDDLLELGRIGGDTDNRQRIERKHAEFRPPA